MKSYREMILSSRKAIVYEIFLNQFTYHSLLCIALWGYSYGVRILYDPAQERRGFLQMLSENAFGLIRLRLFFGCASLLSEFWGLKMIIVKK